MHSVGFCLQGQTAIHQNVQFVVRPMSHSLSSKLLARTKNKSSTPMFLLQLSVFFLLTSELACEVSHTKNIWAPPIGAGLALAKTGASPSLTRWEPVSYVHNIPTFLRMLECCYGWFGKSNFFCAEFWIKKFRLMTKRNRCLLFNFCLLVMFSRSCKLLFFVRHA